MFKNPTDEERLCMTLKALVEEWGPEVVTVAVPAKWHEFQKDLGRVKLECTTNKTVEIRVKTDCVDICHVTELLYD